MDKKSEMKTVNLSFSLDAEISEDDNNTGISSLCEYLLVFMLFSSIAHLIMLGDRDH